MSDHARDHATTHYPGGPDELSLSPFMSALATALAGNGLDASAGTLVVDPEEFTPAMAGHGLDPNGDLLDVDETELDHALIGGTSPDVPKSLYDANTILKADSDNTPAALTMGASTILARLAAGVIKAATPAEIRTLLDVPTNAEAILDTLLDAKGDLIVASAADTPAIQAAGSDYTVPQWLAAATNGLQAGPTTQTWTPTVAQGVSTNINKTVNLADFIQIGPLVFAWVQITATAAGTAGSAITLTLPVNSAFTGIVGTGRYIDSGTATYKAICVIESATTMALIRTDDTNNTRIGANPNIAVANNDIWGAVICYRK